MSSASFLPKASLAAVLAITAAPALDISAAWTGTVSRNWGDALNWSPAQIPDEGAGNRFDVTLPAYEPLPVQLNLSPAIDTLQIGNDTSLAVENARALTIHESITNGGTITLAAATSTTSLSIDDTGGDMTVEIAGSGSIQLSSVHHQITGSIGHKLVHGVGHTIEGAGNIGANSINIENHGIVHANLAGQTLVIDPASTCDNRGPIYASGGGILQLLTGNYSSASGGSFSVGDGSIIRLSGATVVDSAFNISDLNLDPSDNLIEVTGSSAVANVTNIATLLVTNGTTLSVTDGDLTNNGIVRLDSTSTTTSISIADNTDHSVTIGGTGSVQLDSAQERITGNSDHTLVNGSGHTIEGAGNLGSNTINIENHGFIHANVSGEMLTINPAATFDNGGQAHASGGGILQLTTGTHSCAFGGGFKVGDASTIRLSGATVVDSTFDISDPNLDLSDNLIEISSSSAMRDVTNMATIVINDGTALSVIGGDLTNNGIVRLDGTSAATSLSVADNSDHYVNIGGSGIIRLDSTHDCITGASNHTLVNGPGHTIEGQGNLGLDSINLVNQGTIDANLSGRVLSIDPVAGVDNASLIRASGGGILRLNTGNHSCAFGGSFQVGDGSIIQLSGATVLYSTFGVDDSNSDISDNVVEVSASAAVQDVTNEATLVINNANTLSVTNGDFTNNGIVRLDGTSTTTSISVMNSAHESVTIGGSGSILLDSIHDNIMGTSGHTLVNGSGHTIEGTGNIGANVINFVNEGIVEANIPGSNLTIDPQSSGFTSEGNLRASGGGILNVIGGAHQKSGLLEIEAGSQANLSGNLTQSGGVTRVNGTLHASQVNLTGGIIDGSGTINAPIFSAALVSPGTTVGTMSTIGSVTFAKGAALRIDVASSASADLLQVGGDLLLQGGTLQLVYTGSPTDLLPTDFLTAANPTGHIVNAFVNAPEGTRVTTLDGTASFTVHYRHSPDSIQLTGFIYNGIPAANKSPDFQGSAFTFHVDEDASIGTVIGELTAIDPEGAIVEYSLAPASPFAINPTNGVITVASPLDFEAQSTYNLTATTTDGKEPVDQQITITIGDVPENNNEHVTDLLTKPGGPFEGETDPAIIGIGADPDADGHSNVFELWRGTKPGVTDAPGHLITKLVTDGGADYGVIEVDVDSAVDDLLVIEMQISLDLDVWLTATPNRVVLSDTGGVRRIEFRVPMEPPSNSRFFLRFLADPAAQ